MGFGSCDQLHATANLSLCLYLFPPLATRFYPCSWSMPYEPSLARAPVAHDRAVRRGPDPV
jgi:hypothetical protein